jgi:hypothetical protein
MHFIYKHGIQQYLWYYDIVGQISRIVIRGFDCNTNLIFKKIILDPIKGYIRIVIGLIIVLPLSLILKLNKGYY